MNYLIAMGTILLLMLGWIGVQHLSRWYAARHPEFGPPKDEGAGCGKHCGCTRPCSESPEEDREPF